MKMLFDRLGSVAEVALALLVFVQFLVVVSRYFLGLNALWGQELAVYLHASSLLLMCGVVFLRGRHVRIDVFSNGFGERGKKTLEFVGFIMLLVPMMIVILVTSIPYVMESWAVLEGSPELSGLPGKFLLKSLIPLFALLMLLAGLKRLVEKHG